MHVHTALVILVHQPLPKATHIWELGREILPVSNSDQDVGSRGASPVAFTFECLYLGGVLSRNEGLF